MKYSDFGRDVVRPVGSATMNNAVYRVPSPLFSCNETYPAHRLARLYSV
ncbi:MAG: hypothetical protein KJN72_06645 [Woeseia sp.]|nr:hypothetical protein [Woeseia sp.]